MANITRADFSKRLQQAFGLSGGDAYKLVDLVFAEISESLVRGEEVKISGFGTFRILEKKSRIGRNPKTGEEAIISARRVASFRPSAEFRNKIRDE